MEKKMQIISDVISERIREKLTDEQMEDMVVLMHTQYDVCKQEGLQDADIFSILMNLAVTCCMYSDRRDMVNKVRYEFLNKNLGILLLESNDYRWSSYKLGPMIGWSLDVWELCSALNGEYNGGVEYWAPKATEAIVKAREFKTEVDTCELQYCTREELQCRYNEIMDTINTYMPRVKHYLRYPLNDGKVPLGVNAADAFKWCESLKQCSVVV